jgi:hypothetical protein
MPLLNLNERNNDFKTAIDDPPENQLYFTAIHEIPVEV